MSVTNFSICNKYNYVLNVLIQLDCPRTKFSVLLSVLLLDIYCYNHCLEDCKILANDAN